MRNKNICFTDVQYGYLSTLQFAGKHSFIPENLVRLSSLGTLFRSILTLLKT